MSGDFWEVMQPELGWMHVQIRRLGVHDADLEDVAQEACLRIAQRWAERDPARHVRPWILAFLVRLCSDYRKRSRNRRLHYSLEESRTAGEGDPEQKVRAVEARELLLCALHSLPDDYQEILVLVVLNELAVTEAAEMLGLPLNTAYTRLRRAKLELAAAVRRLTLKGQP